MVRTYAQLGLQGGGALRLMRCSCCCRLRCLRALRQIWIEADRTVELQVNRRRVALRASCCNFLSPSFKNNSGASERHRRHVGVADEQGNLRHKNQK